jgi:branched-chain amino acid transport system substrate-binding protein
LSFRPLFFVSVLTFSLPILAAAPTPQGTGPADENQEIVIGGVAPLTGEAATFGDSCKGGYDLAVEEWNARGGLLGKRIRLVMADDKGEPADGEKAFTHLVQVEHAVAILGTVQSKVSVVGAPICQAAQVPMIAPTATSLAVTKVGDYIFRACFVDAFQGTIGAKFAYEKLKSRKAACLFDDTNEYTTTIAESFRTKFTELGGKIVGFESHVPGTLDYREQLNRILASKPDVIYLSDYYWDVSLILRQVRSLGFKGDLVGDDGWDSPQLFERAGAATEGGFYSNHFVDDDPTPAIRAFVQKYKKRFNFPADVLSVLGYDSACMMFEAIQRAGKLDGPAIRDALAATDSSFVTGRVRFDADRNPLKPMVFTVMRGGVVMYHSTVQP